MATSGWSGWTPPVKSPPTKRQPLATRAVEVGLGIREAEIQRECEAWLRGEVEAGSVLCWYHARTPTKDQPGFPDLVIGLRDGLVVAVELKTSLGTTTEPQDRWLAAWGDHGAVCRSVDEMVERIRAWRDQG